MKTRRRGLNLKEYVKLLKYFRLLQGMRFVMSVHSFLDYFCERMQEKLEECRKRSCYYYIINPVDILIVDQKGMVSIEVQLELHQNSFVESK